MKVAVLGAGAIGAYVGAALHRAGADVHLVARGPHLAAMRQHGVRVRSPRGDFTARAHATDDPSGIGPVDYVFLGLKANSYAACGPLIDPLLHSSTAVIAAQNGIPWWYFHRHGGPHDGQRIESVDPDGAVSAVLAPEWAIGCVALDGQEARVP
ncbi:ketopantoate reductase family protein, partial [Streptomyces sp. NPDC056728]